MKRPSYNKILNQKIDYYGETNAAYQFAGEEYEKQITDYLESNIPILPTDKEIDNKADSIEIYPPLQLALAQKKAWVKGAKWLKSQIKLESKKHKLLIDKEIDNTCCGLDNIDGTDGRCLMCGSKDNL